MITVFWLILIVCFYDGGQCISSRHKFWTYDEYPDIKAASGDLCGKHVPKLGYVCDPDNVTTSEQAQKLNNVLYNIATKTRCKCQRRSQCMAQTGPNFQKIYVGFVVVIAFTHDIAWSASSDLEYYNTAEKFSRGLRDHWILGDCGNSVLILVWERRMLIHVWADEKASLYVTPREKERILSEIGQISNRKDIFDALLYILGEMKKQFDGEPEKPTDIGKLALITASSVAMISVVFVMGCVCAFRFQIGSCRRDDLEVLDGDIDGKIIFDHRVDDNDLIINSSPSPPSTLRNNYIMTRGEFV